VEVVEGRELETGSGVCSAAEFGPHMTGFYSGPWSMKDKGMADPGVITACVELCDDLNCKVAVASKSMLLLQHGGDAAY
jgi:hypothetical protein